MKSPYRIPLIILIILNFLGIGTYFFTGSSFWLFPCMGSMAAAAVIWLNRRIIGASAGWESSAYLGVLVFVLMLALGSYVGISRDNPWHRFISTNAMGLAGVITLFGVVEFIVLRFLNNFRLGAIVRITYYEALAHPFTLIVLCVGIFINSFVAYSLPYYTLAEDFKMYRDVAAGFAQFGALLVMVFASAKVIDEEIENRTMLTLMAKPIARWQVVIGKYLGVVLIVFVIIAVLGTATMLGSYLRFFEDMRLDIDMARNSPFKDELPTLLWTNTRGLLALLPLFTLQFLQLATLAAVAVAISTRYSLALNITAIVVLYVGANLTRFVSDLALAQPWQWIATHFVLLLPFLTNFDLDQRLIYGQITVGNEFIDKTVPMYSSIWQYTGLAAVYAILYIGAALSLATALFRTRELT